VRCDIALLCLAKTQKKMILLSLTSRYYHAAAKASSNLIPLVLTSQSSSSICTLCKCRMYGTSSSGTGDYTQIIARNAKKNVSLNNLRDLPGAKKQKLRIGRGAGTKVGKTSGRGHLGQKAHGGGVHPGFEGGQTPAYRRQRKYGFTNARFARRWAIVNLDRLQLWIDTGRIDPTKKITMKELLDTGCAGKLRRKQQGVKLLGVGTEKFSSPVNIEVSQASSSAIQAIEQNGGKVRLVYYDTVGLRSLLRPEKYRKQMPYLKPPRSYKNRKLRRPQEQPDQHPQWIAARNEMLARKAEKSEEL